MIIQCQLLDALSMLFLVLNPMMCQIFFGIKKGLKKILFFNGLNCIPVCFLANLYEYLQNTTTLNMNNHASIICQFNCLLAFWWEGFFERKDKLDKVLIRKSFSNYSVQTYHELSYRYLHY